LEYVESAHWARVPLDCWAPAWAGISLYSQLHPRNMKFEVLSAGPAPSI
jgi:hypothetical protein